jgi:hypothetical protein
MSPRKLRSPRKKTDKKRSGVPHGGQAKASEPVFPAPQTPPPPPPVSLNPVFAEPGYMQDPTQFKAPHASDKTAYNELDQLQKLHEFNPLPFPTIEGQDEPILLLSTAFGSAGTDKLRAIENNKQRVVGSSPTRLTTYFQQLSLVGLFRIWSPNEVHLWGYAVKM